MNIVSKGSWRQAAILALAAFFVSSTVRSELLPHTLPEPNPAQLAYLQRSITLLNSATASDRKNFKILFYGDSHQVATLWWYQLTLLLRETYPHVNIQVENKAVQGFQAGDLARTAYADIVSSQPDLILVHCFGPEADHERLDQTIRSLTTADVMIQSDHPLTDAERDEGFDEDPTGPATFYVNRNYRFLPALANAAGLCFADERSPWKQYLIDNGLRARVMLGPDNHHFNADGDLLQKEIIFGFLKPRTFANPIDPYNTPRIQTKSVGQDIHWVDGALRLAFVGNRVDVVYEANPPLDSPTYTYTIDGETPRARPELFDFNRASPTHWMLWPGIGHVIAGALLQEETWTLTVTGFDTQSREVQYEVQGSKTGFDGSGSSLTDFTSNSRRVVIEANQVLIGADYFVSNRVPPERFSIQFGAVARFVDTFKPVAAASSGFESVETLFIATSEKPHILRIPALNGNQKGIKAIRVYSPSGGASLIDYQDPVTAFGVRLSATSAIITWPLSFGEGKVQFSGALTPPVSWPQVPGKAEKTATGYRLEHPLVQGPVFYRFTP